MYVIAIGGVESSDYVAGPWFGGWGLAISLVPMKYGF